MKWNLTPCVILLLSWAALPAETVIVVSRDGDRIAEYRAELLDSNPYALVLGLMPNAVGGYGMRLTLPTDQIVSIDGRAPAELDWRRGVDEHALRVRVRETTEADEGLRVRTRHDVLVGRARPGWRGVTLLDEESPGVHLPWPALDGVDGGTVEAFLWSRCDVLGAVGRPISAGLGPLLQLTTRRVALAFDADAFPALLALLGALVSGAYLGGFVLVRIAVPRAAARKVGTRVVAALLAGMALLGLGLAAADELALSGVAVIEALWLLGVVAGSAWVSAALAGVRGRRAVALAASVLITALAAAAGIFLALSPVVARLLAR